MGVLTWLRSSSSVTSSRWWKRLALPQGSRRARSGPARSNGRALRLPARQSLGRRRKPRALASNPRPATLSAFARTLLFTFEILTTGASLRLASRASRLLDSAARCDELMQHYPKHYCGLFGIYGHLNAAELTYYGLYALQHRGIFSQDGFAVELTKQTRDGGRDIIAIKSNLGIKSKFIIECKRYAANKPVSVALVRALYGAQTQEGANKSVLATTSRFTPAAHSFAKGRNTTEWLMDLRDFNDIYQWIKSTPTTNKSFKGE